MLAVNPLTVTQLADHFEQRELGSDNTWRSHATKKTYKGHMRRWIVPYWGKRRLFEVKTIEVESWLRRLPLAKSTCAKLRNLMSVMIWNSASPQFDDMLALSLSKR